jgi:NADPH2:quinone reductase
MRAVGYLEPGAIDRADALLDVDLPDPVVAGRDLLVEVRAISVNPVDTKIRAFMPSHGGAHTVLGWDVAGVVVATGPEVSQFKVGDAVFYSGTLGRPGANSQLHAVDERIVGRKPASLDWGEAAALPLTTLTAWEALFDRLDVRRPVTGAANAILIAGGAGGVASIAVQFACRLTDLTVIATSSRPETAAWLKEMGAHHVVDHGKPLAEQVMALGIGMPAFVLSTNYTERHLEEIGKLIAPQGRLCTTDDDAVFPSTGNLKMKSVSIHLEMVFTRSMFQTADMPRQGEILNEVAQLIDAGTLRTTRGEELAPINAENLKRAHGMIESRSTIGKIVLAGWA